MLLRSSSTPVLGSLLSSISESPNNNNHVETNNNNSRHPPTFLCNSSPISPSVHKSFNMKGHSYNGVRRVRSEGNLEALAYASCHNHNNDFYNSKQPQMLSGKGKGSMLESIPSFSLNKLRGGYDEIGEEEEMEDVEETREVSGKNDDVLSNYAKIEETIMVVKNKDMGITKEKGFKSNYCNVSYSEAREMINSEMYLARGLGIGIGGFGSGGGGRGGGGDFTPGSSGNNAGDDNNSGIEEYYRRRLDENPGNPLYLRNYAQFLYQTKKDLEGAEEYYSRAILADPRDGDILCEYAKLIWELQHDEDRALSYFERAVQAAPEDSHVQAAYASFIWETEESEIEDRGALTQVIHGTVANVGA